MARSEISCDWLSSLDCVNESLGSARAKTRKRGNTRSLDVIEFNF